MRPAVRGGPLQAFCDPLSSVASLPAHAAALQGHVYGYFKRCWGWGGGRRKNPSPRDLDPFPSDLHIRIWQRRSRSLLQFPAAQSWNVSMGEGRGGWVAGWVNGSLW